MRTHCDDGSPCKVSNLCRYEHCVLVGLEQQGYTIKDGVVVEKPKEEVK